MVSDTFIRGAIADALPSFCRMEYHTIFDPLIFRQRVPGWYEVRCVSPCSKLESNLTAGLSVQRFYGLMKEIGVNVRALKWNPVYKGIGDMLLAKAKA